MINLHRSVNLRACVVAVVLVCAFSATPAHANNRPIFPMPSPQRLEDVISQGVQWLYSQQQNGNWEVSQVQLARDDGDPTKGQWGGYTALVAYTLLAAGEDPKEPHLAKAIDFLKQANITGNYALGMRCNVWQLLLEQEVPRSPQTQQLIEHDADLLFRSVIKNPPTASGMYNYTIFPDLDTWHVCDHSVSQFAMLGMWAAFNADVEIPESYWRLVEQGWLRDQDASGAWGYQNPPGNSAPKNSMTIAGIATLFILEDVLHGHEGLNCPGNRKTPAIDRGIAWLAPRFFDDDNCYNWYGISRVGIASGYKYIGTIDWFREGAGELAAGYVKPPWEGEHGRIPNSCYAILFLVRGRAPVMINKLQYWLDEHGDTPKEANWNERSRDAANLVKWASHESEKFLNWQIINMRIPGEDMHEAPILYIAGDRQGLSFTRDEEAKLRRFVEEGGLILGNADCQSKQFADQFRKLGTTLFPDYEFRRLGADHLLMHNQFDSAKWHEKIVVDGLSNGARELMLLFPTNDPSRFWQTRAYRGHEALHEFLFNVWFYLTDKQPPRFKGQTYLVQADGTAATRTIKVARLQYNGNWDPEPGGWRRLAAVMHNDEHIDLSVQTVPLGSGQLAGFKVAHLTGTFKFALTPDQQAQLKQFVQGGGTLIIDSCGGAQEFTDAAKQQLSEIFGADAAQLDKMLPPDAPALSAGAVKLTRVAYRRAAAKTIGAMAGPPRVRGIQIGNRLAVIFSPEDLSVALVGQSVDGIYGYAPQPGKKDDAGDAPAGASQIMASLLKYADGQLSYEAVARDRQPVRQPGPVQSGPIIIKSAVYGDLPDGTKADVTNRVIDLVKNGAFAVDAANQNFGDPTPGVSKKLRIDYTIGGKDYSQTVNEGGTLRLDASGAP